MIAPTKANDRGVASAHLLYAELTIERYLEPVETISKDFHRGPDQLGLEQIREYLLHLVQH